MKSIWKVAAVATALMCGTAAKADVVTVSGAGFGIFDLTNSASTIGVAQTGTVQSVTFTLAGFSHAWVGDLVASVTHGGQTAVLFDREGVNRDVDGTYVFDFASLAAFPTTAGDAVSAGTYRFIGSSFAGASLAGDWTLSLRDAAGGVEGNLGSWSLTAVTASAAVPEPATWAMMILGFGLIGGAVRRRTAASVRVGFA